MELLITDAEAEAIWKRVSGYKENALIRLYKRDVAEFLQDRRTLLDEVSRLALLLKKCEDSKVPVVFLDEPAQQDNNIQYWALDPGHANYATIITLLSATASSVPAPYGAYAVAAGGNGYTGLNIVGPTYISNSDIASNSMLTIGGCVKDRVNYSKCRALNYAAPTMHTNRWGEQHRKYGVFLRAPKTIPRTGYDRLIAWMKGTGSDAVTFIGATNGEDGSDGSSYRKRKKVSDVLGATTVFDISAKNILVLCGTISRYTSEGNQGGASAGSAFVVPQGTINQRTQILAHSVDGAKVYGGAKAGNGSPGGWGDPADWTSVGSGTYSIDVNVHNPFLSISASIEIYNITDAGGTIRPLTLAASQAACLATGDTWFPEIDYSGSNDRIFVHLADGSDPKTTTYLGVLSGGGVNFDISNKQYFDVFGVEFYGCGFTGTNATGSKRFSFYACKFFYGNRWFTDNYTTLDEGTGAYNPIVSSDRRWQGCHWSHYYACVYDGNLGDKMVPTGTYFEDNLCEYGNLKPADNYGVQNYSAADLHSVATQGADGHYVINNVFRYGGPQTITHYVQAFNYTTPSGGLELTDLYTLGVPLAESFDMGDGTHTHVPPCKNLVISWNWIYEMKNTGDYAASEDQVISLNGDYPQMLFSFGRGDNIIIEYNRIEDVGRDGCFRLKFGYTQDQTSFPIIRYNTIRADNAVWGIYAINAVLYGNPTPEFYEPSFVAYGNDFLTAGKFIFLINYTNPTNRSVTLYNNTYRNNNGGTWQVGASNVSTLAAYSALADTGDTLDATGSRHVAIGA